MKNGQKVINLIGGPCSGKSTAAAEIFARLKKAGYNVELVTEVAKEHVWNDCPTILKNQIYIFGDQYNRLWRLIGKVDFIITDSPLPVGLFYSVERSKNFLNLIVEKYKDFDNLMYFIDRGDSEFQPTGRVHTYEESLEADRRMKELLSDYEIPYTVVQQRTAVEEIMDFIVKEYSL